MRQTPVTSDSQGRSLLVLLGGAVLVVMLLLSYQMWLSYRDQVANAETASRNYAAIFEARLDATLRRVDADLKSLTREVPVAALNRQAVPRYAQALNGRLDSRLFNFKEIAGYQVTDVRGDTLYTSGSATTARANVSDRGYFQILRDNPQAGLVFSEVVTGRTTGRQVIAVARGLRDGNGAFLGIVYGILELDYLQTLFRFVDLGPQGSIALRRSDNNALVVRHPELPMEVNRPASDDNPMANAMAG